VARLALGEMTCSRKVFQTRVTDCAEPTREDGGTLTLEPRKMGVDARVTKPTPASEQGLFYVSHVRPTTEDAPPAQKPRPFPYPPESPPEKVPALFLGWSTTFRKVPALFPAPLAARKINFSRLPWA
jgi:hypothetical protein